MDGFGQGIVIGVPHAAHRRLNAGFCQTLGISDRYVLHPAVTVVNQTAVPYWPEVI